jgi:hypothetical protein
MSYLRGFAPWIGYGIVGVISWPAGALAALLLALGLAGLDRRAGARWDAQLLDGGSIVFFAALTAVAFADPDSIVRHWGSPLSTGWLLVIALVSLAVRQPFTLGIARRRVAPEVAANPAFRHTNTVVSSIWAGAFAVLTAAGVLSVLLSGGALVQLGYQGVVLVGAILATRGYTTRVRRAAAAAATPTATAVRPAQPIG